MFSVECGLELKVIQDANALSFLSFLCQTFFRLRPCFVPRAFLSCVFLFFLCRPSRSFCVPLTIFVMYRMYSRPAGL